MIPPHLLEKLLESTDADIRRVALATLRDTTRLRGERTVRASFAGAAVPANGRRTIFDCHHRTVTDLADVRRSEDGAPSGDPSVDQAFDGFEKTRRFYSEVLQRNSIDNRGMRLDGYVHYGNRFNNAFWDGRKMVFGDGDGRMFTDFTSSVVDTETTRTDSYLAPFRDAIAAGIPFVMVALATYQQIDPSTLAVFSPVVQRQLLRDSLAFNGVVVSDDLGATAAVANITPADRAVNFLAAGGDLIISKTIAPAFEMAAAASVVAGSPTPQGFSLGRSMSSMSISGTSGNVRIG